jgi:hypothetical protein
MDCPPRWSISGIVMGTAWQHPNPAKFAKQRIVDGILLALIAIQWLIIGGFPLRPGESLRRDPVALITVCTLCAGAISLIPEIGLLSGLLMMIAAAAWFWWLGLLLRTLFHSARLKLSARRAAHQK